MQPDLAQALARDPVYRRQNRHLKELCAALSLPLADATEDLVQAEEAGIRQFWEWDTHPRPTGYSTIARRIHQALYGGKP
jgi:lysophospholipase L1-like esterase